MTNEKLLEIAICGYLPYGVKVLRPDGKTILPVVGIEGELMIFHEDGSPHKTYGDFSGKTKLQLHSINCLTKPITVPNYNDGNEFVPLVELAKLTISQLKYASVSMHDYKDVTFGSRYEFVFNIGSGEYFSFDSERQSFVYGMATRNGKYMVTAVHNQSGMFDLMNQWLIDWRGLIDKGLAVEIKE